MADIHKFYSASSRSHERSAEGRSCRNQRKCQTGRVKSVLTSQSTSSHHHASSWTSYEGSPPAEGESCVTFMTEKPVCSRASGSFCIQITLTNFYGIGLHMAERLMARLSIHHRVLTGDVSEAQYTALSAYLSSTTTHPTPAPTPICPPGMSPSDANYKPTTSVKKEDPLESLKIETDLRRATKSDIAHLVAIGTYRGRRYAVYLMRAQHPKCFGLANHSCLSFL